MTDKGILDKLNAILGADRVLTMEPMSKHTTFRVGGPADYFLSPKSAEEIGALILLAKEEGIPYIIHGKGSNLLVGDGGIRGFIIHLGENFREVEISGTKIRVQAGALLSTVAKRASEASLTGLEFAAGIPGSLGGAIVMNAGAYGGEMKQVVETVTCMLPDGEIKTYSGEEMCFGYRDSLVKRQPMIVLEAVLTLKTGEQEQIKEVMSELARRRLEKQPLEFPSAGSTFKRPEGYFAGELIMKAGFAGERIGDAMISAKHCGFLVNAGNATAKDIKELIGVVQAGVWEKYKVRLEPEVIFLGDEG